MTQTSTTRGKFITFDGIDGAGKTTQIELLVEWLRVQGKAVHVTREPGGTALAEKIRALLLDKDNRMDSLTELLLMFASRAEHLKSVLQPKLCAGEWVVCSRFTDATLAYQGYARGESLHDIRTIANVVHGDCNPDMSFFLDIPAELAAARREFRGEADDRIEAEALSFMHSVRHGYLAIAADEPQRCKVVDATQPIDVIASSIAERARVLL